MTDKNQINIDSLIDLASLEVTDVEKEEFEAELADFLEYAAVIKSAPRHLPPASHAVDKEQLIKFYEDEYYQK